MGGMAGWLVEAIRAHGLLAVVLGVAVETVVVPLPSPVILMAAGFILVTAGGFWQALLQSLAISVVAGAAQTLGSYFVYGLASWGGRPLIERYERWHGVSWKEIEDFKRGFERGGKEGATLFLLRAIPVVPLSVVSGVAGVIKMDFRRFTTWTFLGTVPRNLFLAMLGWQLAGAYGKLALWINSAETLVTIVVVVALAGYVLAHRFKDKLQKSF